MSDGSKSLWRRLRESFFGLRKRERYKASRRRRLLERLEDRSLLAVDLILPTFDGHAEDTTANGAFVSLTTTTTPVRVLSPSLGFERRGIFEFDVSRLDPALTINSAVFEFAATGTISTATRVLDVYALTGDGLLTSADASTSGVLLGSSSSVVSSVVGGTVYQIPLNATALRAAAQGNYLTIQLRMAGGGGLELPSLEAVSMPDAWKPKLIVDSSGTAGPSLSVRLGGNLPENAQPGAASGTVTRVNSDTSSDLTVTLLSLDASELQVPATVTIPAGATSATFALNAVDDALLDGNQAVAVRATAVDHRDGQASVLVTDFEPILLSISPTSVSEAAGVGAATVTVTVPGGHTQDLVVTLVSRNTAKASVPASVTVPVGVTTVSFTVDVFDNEIVDGNSSVRIDASAVSYATGSATLLVTDDDGGKLRAGNILVAADNRFVYEYRPDGQRVQTFTLNNVGSGMVRDVVVDENGRIQVVKDDTTFVTALTTIDVATGSMTSRGFTNWTAGGNIAGGGIASAGRYLYTSDSGNSTTNQGVVRWDTANNYAAQRFSTDISITDVSIGLDGLLYALQGDISPANLVRVLNPTTGALIRSIALPLSSHYGIAVDAAGNIYGSAWGNTIYKYDSNGRLIDYLITDHPIKDIDVAPDGRILATAVELADGSYVVMTDSTLESYTSFKVTTGAGIFAAFTNPNYIADPQVTTSAGVTTFTEGSSVFVDPNLTLADDGAVIRGAEVKIVSGYSVGDSLFGSSFGGVAFTGFNSTTGTATFTGSASVSTYETILRTLRFENFGQAPKAGERVIQFSVSDYGWVGTATKTVNVVPVNDGAPSAVNNSYTVAEDGTLNVAPTESTVLKMTSDPGDWVGQGGSYNVTNGVLSQQFGDRGGRFTFGDWSVTLTAPSTLALGRYDNATRSPSGPMPTIDISGLGRGNGFNLGYFVVKEFEFGVTGTLTRFAADFVQYGEAEKPALRGSIDYRATYGTKSGVLANDSDIDGSRMTVPAYTQPVSGGVVNVQTNGAFQYTPASDFYGVDTFTYSASDEEGGVSVATVSVTVTPVNDAPRVTSPTFNTTEEVAVEGILAVEVDGEPLTIAIVAPPLNGLLELLGGGAVRYTPSANFSGTDSFSYTASDGVTAPVSARARIVVAAVNDSPTLNPITDVTVAEDAGVQQTSLTGITAGGGESQTLAISASSSNPALVANPVVAYNSGDSTAILSWASSANQSGQSTITVTVTDAGLDGQLGTSDDGTSSQQYVITVAPVNDAPTLNLIADAAVAEDAGAQQTSLTGISAGGGESQSLAVSVSSSNPALIANPVVAYNSGDSTATLSWASSANQSGQSTITVTVTDAGLDGQLGTSDDGTSSQQYVITVTPVNDLPTLNSIAAVTVAEDAGAQQTSLTGISAGGGESQLLAVSVSSSNPALIANPVVAYNSGDSTATLDWTPTADQSGQATITVTVTDAGLDGQLGTSDDGTSSQQYVITVTPVNDLPTLNSIAAVTVAEDAGVQQTSLMGISAGGGESQSLAVSVSSSNPALIANPVVAYNSGDSTATLDWTPTADQSGQATITVTVTDAGLDGQLGTSDDGTSSQQYVITVTPVNDPPQMANQQFSIAENSTNNTLVGTVVATDLEAGTLSFSIVNSTAAGTFAMDATTGALRVANSALLDYEARTSVTMTVRVSDGIASTDAQVIVNLTDVLEIRMDITPGDSSNQVDLSGKITVAILGGAGLNLNSIDVNSLRFGKTGTEDSIVRKGRNNSAQFSFSDTNGDGILDLVVQFEGSRTGLTSTDTRAILTGRFLSGATFSLTDYVKPKTKGRR
jgi:hypothetical protein